MEKLKNEIKDIWYIWIDEHKSNDLNNIICKINEENIFELIKYIPSNKLIIYSQKKTRNK